jgi:recombination associated protein RdgC
MSEWLRGKEAPVGFSVDRDCELKQPDSEKAAVRYARHVLDIDEVGEHIAQGKLPTRLAMSFAGRVSFELTETMALRKIKLLDIVLEGAGAPGRDEGFDADVALTTGELGPLLDALLEALGGELGAANDEPLAALMPARVAGRHCVQFSRCRVRFARRAVLRDGRLWRNPR